MLPRIAERLQKFAIGALDGHGYKGVYFWGAVGRGKTMLLSLIYLSIQVRHNSSQVEENC